jgi:hypothetical protein
LRDSRLEGEDTSLFLALILLSPDGYWQILAGHRASRGSPKCRWIYPSSSVSSFHFTYIPVFPISLLCINPALPSMSSTTQAKTTAHPTNTPHTSHTTAAVSPNSQPTTDTTGTQDSGQQNTQTQTRSPDPPDSPTSPTVIGTSPVGQTGNR